MNSHGGHKRGISQEEDRPPWHGPPKRGRFDNVSGGTMSRSGKGVPQNNSQGEPSSDSGRQNEDQSRGSGKGGSQGGAPAVGKGVGSTLSRLMDLATSSDSGSGKPSAGSHSQGADSSFVDNDHRNQQQRRSNGSGGRGRGTRDQGFRGRGNRVGDFGQSRDAGRGSRDAGRGSRDAGRGSRDAGRGIRPLVGDFGNPRDTGRGIKPLVGDFGHPRDTGRGIRPLVGDFGHPRDAGHGIRPSVGDFGNPRDAGRGIKPLVGDFGHPRDTGRGITPLIGDFGNPRDTGRGIKPLVGDFSHPRDTGHPIRSSVGDFGNPRDTGHPIRSSVGDFGNPRDPGRGIRPLVGDFGNPRDTNRTIKPLVKEYGHRSDTGGGFMPLDRGSPDLGRGIGYDAAPQFGPDDGGFDIQGGYQQDLFSGDRRPEGRGGPHGGFIQRGGEHGRGGQFGSGGGRGRGDAPRGNWRGGGSMTSRLMDLASSGDSAVLDPSNFSEGWEQGGDRGRGRGVGERGRGRGLGERDRGRGVGEQGWGRGLGEQGWGGGVGEQGWGEGVGEWDHGRGFGERGRGRGLGEQGHGRGFGEQGRGRGFGEQGRGRGFGERGRGRGGPHGGERVAGGGYPADSGNPSRGGEQSGVGDRGQEQKGKGESNPETVRGKSGLDCRGKLMTRENGTTYYLRNEHTLLKNSKFQEVQCQLPMLDRFKNLCESAKPLVAEPPELELASTTLETLLLMDNVCLTPGYTTKAERIDDLQPFVFRCKVYINNICLGTSVAWNKKEGKLKACTEAIKVLGTKDAQVIIDTHEKVDDVMKIGKEAADIVESPFSSAESNIANILSVPESDEKRSRADFYILQPEELVDANGMRSTLMNSTFVLRQSADFSHMLLTYEYTKSPEGFLCTVNIEGETIATATAKEQHISKNLASHAALDSLRQTNWTIVIIKRDRPKPATQPLHAICGRIRPNDPKSRQRFMYKLRIYLRTYLNGLRDYTERLSLSTKLNREENDAVYTIGKEMDIAVSARRPDGSKNPRMTAKDPRFLVLSKKFLSRDLFDYIWEKGGETWRYRLKPPGELASDINPLGTADCNLWK